MRPQSTHAGSARQRGVTMVELMVSITISLLLLLGMTTLFSNTSLNFRVNDELARLQENGAAALRYLVGDARNAGFYGIGGAVLSIDWNSVNGIAIANDCGSPVGGHAWALQLDAPLSVTTGLDASTANATFPCIAGANFYPGSPVIVIRGAAGTAISAPLGGTIDAALAAQPDYSNTLYVQGSTDDPNTMLFFGSAYAALRAANPRNIRTLKGGTDAPAFEYQTHVYYIRPCSRPSGGSGTLCTAGDDGGAPIPTLVRQELIASRMQEVALVEGVEWLGLSYGIDSTGASGLPYGPGDIPDGIADQYTSVAPASFAQVVDLRISVRVRSTSAVAGQDDSGKSYDLGGGASFTCSGGDCRYMRQVYAQSAQLRNCVLRRQGEGSC